MRCERCRFEDTCDTSKVVKKYNDKQLTDIIDRNCDEFKSKKEVRE